MATIYRLGFDKVLGRIDSSSGRIYDSTSGQDEYIGWVDYEAGEVFDEADDLVGWVDEEGKIFVSYEYDEDEDEDEDEEEVEGERIGYVKENGKLYAYTATEDKELGQITDMTDPVEAAAGLLFFFEEEEA